MTKDLKQLVCMYMFNNEKTKQKPKSVCICINLI